MLDLRRAISITVGTIVLIGFGSSVARLIVRSDGLAARQRLEIVWPDFAKMGDRDRALLASLALACKLKDRTKDPAAVLECLQEGVDSDNPHFPYGMDRNQVQARLTEPIPQRSKERPA